MSAHQGLHQAQKQTQSLILAPQLRQSLKILQAPALELRNAILEELQSNPALEEMPMEGISLEERASDPNDTGDDSRGDELDFTENFEKLKQLDEDWRDYYAQESGARGRSSEDAEKRQRFFDSLVGEVSLQERLMRQAELTDAEPETLAALEHLIGCLDDRGFIVESVSDIALMANMPLKAMQEAHRLLKTLDPPGIGSADTRECLLAQLRQNGKSKTLAAEILRSQYDLLLRRRVPELARKLGVDAEDVQKAIESIASLDPAPGRKFGEDSNIVVVPDVTVEKDGDEWIITLNSDYIPRLRLSAAYKTLIAKGQIGQREKDYIQNKIRSGKFLMSSIEQRQQTIERITREILKFQGDFFEIGPSKLRPLTMSAVAEQVGVHETTVSRAIANKYIDTPHGVYEFKYFFTPGYKGKDGESVSNTSIKSRIKQIIDSENPAKPYSDQEIVNILSEEDVKIARRTVAKYREELGILSTSMRRRYN